MVKEIKVAVDDADYEILIKAKGELTWREFLLLGVKPVDKKTL